MEIVAAARLYRCTVQVHLLGQPSYLVAPEQNEGRRGTRVCELSYHGQDHYNAVRHADGSGELGDPPEDAAAAAAAAAARSVAPAPRSATSAPPADEPTEAEASCMETTGCASLDHVRRRLHEDAGGELELAVELLLREKEDGVDWELGFPEEATPLTAAEKRAAKREARAAKKLQKQRKKDERKERKERRERASSGSDEDGDAESGVEGLTKGVGTISI